MRSSQGIGQFAAFELYLRGDNPRSAPLLLDSSRDFSIQGVVVGLVCRDL